MIGATLDMDALPSWIPGVPQQSAPPEAQQSVTVDNADGSKTKFTIFNNVWKAPEPPKPEAQTSTIENGDGSKTKITFLTPPRPRSAPVYPYYPYPPLPTEQGPIVIVLPDVEPPPKPPTPPPTPEPVVIIKVVEAPKPPPPQKFSNFSISSVVLFALALMFGIGCVAMTYQAYDGRQAGLTDDDEEYASDRTVAVGTGIVATLLFHVATMLIFYAGMRYKSKSKLKGKRKDKCCLSTVLIGAAVVFGITFMLDLILLVMALDGEKLIYPAAVWVALAGSVVAWMLMFGYSEVARRAG